MNILLNPEKGYIPGGFLGVELREGGVLYAKVAFLHARLKIGEMYRATGSDGSRLWVKIPECNGLKEERSTVLGLREPGLETRYLHDA